MGRQQVNGARNAPSSFPSLLLREISLNQNRTETLHSGGAWCRSNPFLERESCRAESREGCPASRREKKDRLAVLYTTTLALSVKSCNEMHWRPNGRSSPAVNFAAARKQAVAGSRLGQVLVCERVKNRMTKEALHPCLDIPLLFSLPPPPR